MDRQTIRDWYNGYNWRGAEKVYNPFDILLLFFNRAFDPYWFEVGTPSFLIKTLAERKIASPSPDGMLGTSTLLSKFDVDAISTDKVEHT
ncbi:MAG: AAA family ATPase [Thiotrichales bacterium]|nr:AAA family ATPase [Thiotrichales bacterium]